MSSRPPLGRQVFLSNRTCNPLYIQKSWTTTGGTQDALWFLPPNFSKIDQIDPSGQTAVRWDCLSGCTHPSNASTCRVGGNLSGHSKAISTKFEATFLAADPNNSDTFDCSMVDGYNVAFIVDFFPSTSTHSPQVCRINCAAMTLSACPSDNLGEANPSQSLLYSEGADMLACWSPCKLAEDLYDGNNYQAGNPITDSDQIKLDYCQYGPSSDLVTCNRKFGSGMQQIPLTGCLEASHYASWAAGDSPFWQPDECAQPCLYENYCMCNGFMNGFFPANPLVKYPASMTNYVQHVHNSCPWTYAFPYDDLNADISLYSSQNYIIAITLVDDTTVLEDQTRTMVYNRIPSPKPENDTSTCNPPPPPNAQTCPDNPPPAPFCPGNGPPGSQAPRPGSQAPRSASQAPIPGSQGPSDSSGQQGFSSAIPWIIGGVVATGISLGIIFFS